MQRLVDVTRSVAAVETSGRVESELAATLRAMAAQDGGAAGARRRSLAADAARGAQAAAELTERLQQHARARAEQDDMTALREALDHAAMLLAGLARAEKRIAGIVGVLASRNGSDGAEQQLQLAAQASAAARRARDLAQTLQRLADAGAGVTQTGGTQVAETMGAQTSVGPWASQRLVDIERRLAEFMPARSTVPGDGVAPAPGRDARLRAQEARRHLQESVARLAQARQLTGDAFGRAARAHARAAEASARSARAGIGDVAEHNRAVAFHRAAASNDWQQAHSIDDQQHDHAASPAETPAPGGSADALRPVSQQRRAGRISGGRADSQQVSSSRVGGD